MLLHRESLSLEDDELLASASDRNGSNSDGEDAKEMSRNSSRESLGQDYVSWGGADIASKGPEVEEKAEEKADVPLVSPPISPGMLIRKVSKNTPINQLMEGQATGLVALRESMQERRNLIEKGQQIINSSRQHRGEAPQQLFFWPTFFLPAHTILTPCN